MKLITEEIKNRMPALYSQENVKDPTVHLKLFHPLGRYKAYVTEGDLNPESDNYGLMFGYVSNLEDEFGYMTLQEIESVKIMGLGIERDMHFDPMPLSEALKRDGRDSHLD